MSFKEAVDLYTLIIQQAFPVALAFYFGNKICRLFVNALEGDISWD